MDIRKLAELINKASVNHEFGRLQDYRKKLKNLSKKPTNKIFTDASISAEGWAFHLGGRSEIQFNIGFEGDRIRYGLAFSLEASQSLPDVSVLYPKILSLNMIFREKPDIFSGYSLWCWSGKRSNTIPMSEIPSAWVRPNNFIFFGKLMDIKNLDIEEILVTFDKMLPIYLEIESGNGIVENRTNKDLGFVFDPQHRKLVANRAYTSIERETNIDVRHSLLQDKLYTMLVKDFGVDQVSLENNFNGNRIDVVRKTESSYIFYEVKTGNSARSCIRQALGQLMEYGFWPGVPNAAELVVVGEPKIDLKARKYLEYLRQTFNFPISYLTVTL
jgi:hypothetical protein